MAKLTLTPEQLRDYDQNGYLIVKNFFNAEEVTKLYHIAVDDSAISKHAININDSAGKRSKLSLWYKPGDDVYGLLTRGASLVNAVDNLLDGDSAVCHFHSKLMQKRTPRGRCLGMASGLWLLV